MKENILLQICCYDCFGTVLLLMTAPLPLECTYFAVTGVISTVNCYER
jgi:hypothetical protein